MVPKASTGFEPVAIIGSACRFPAERRRRRHSGNLLRRGTDFVGPVPAGRWDGEAFRRWCEPSRYHLLPGGGLRLMGWTASTRVSSGYPLPRLAKLDPPAAVAAGRSQEYMERAGLCSGTPEGSHATVYVGMLGMDYLTACARDRYPERSITFYAAGRGSLRRRAHRLSPWRARSGDGG
ncbi:beta-ketoacyl synthase N-terminal-like domain-containing protein [Pseudomonas aeruginosa]